MATGRKNNITTEFYLAPARRTAGRTRLIAGLATVTAIAVALALALSAGSGRQGARIQPAAIFPDTRSDADHYDPYTGAAARPMGICGNPPHRDCVADGDTFWLNGDQIRIANIDAPEMEARCLAHASRAGEARRTLVRILDRVPLEIHATGRDRKRRLLARVRTPEGDVGIRMLNWHVAVPWYPGSSAETDWCS